MRMVVVAGAFCCVLAGAAAAQIPFPTQAPPQDGHTLFLNQCGTCHSALKGDAPRQGPNLFGVYGRKAGTFPGFKYSAGFAQADWVWDEAHLDQWLTNPQAMIPGAVMLYHQSNPKIRALIIGWLKEQH